MKRRYFNALRKDNKIQTIGFVDRSDFETIGDYQKHLIDECKRLKSEENCTVVVSQVYCPCSVAKSILNEFEKMTNFKCFEIGAMPSMGNDKEFILFNISIEGNEMIATHEALTEEEKESEKIAFKSISIDIDFDLSEHISMLYNVCESAIDESNFYFLN